MEYDNDECDVEQAKSVSIIWNIWRMMSREIDLETPILELDLKKKK